MDATKVLIIVGYYVAAYAICCIVSMVVIGLLLKAIILSDPKASDTGPLSRRDAKFFNLARLVGSLEQVIYITAILIGQPAFIGVWLIFKVVDDFRRDWSVYSLFLIGNALSLIFAAVTALLIQQLLPPFPSLHQWSIPIP